MEIQGLPHSLIFLRKKTTTPPVHFFHPIFYLGSSF
jgi:hypothetical protein